MANSVNRRLRWKLLVGVAVILGVFVACQALPGPFNIVIPVMIAVGLGGAIGGKQRRG